VTGELSPDPWEIGEEQILQAQPKVRALQIQRLELIWNLVEARIKEADELPIDPRFLEIGLRTLKAEETLYRLTKPAPPSEDEEQDPQALSTERKAMLLRTLEELEQKLAPPPKAEPEPQD
jgi:hypothetical protein